MHVERIREVAETIRKNDDRYNQSLFFHPGCGSPACIAGWTVALDEAHGNRDAARDWNLDPIGDAVAARADSISARAERILGLDADQAEALFASTPMMLDEDGDMFEGIPTADQAADTLLRLADTGEIRWCAPLPPL